MHSNGIDAIYSPHVRNTATSSTTTMIVPESSPPSDNNDEESEMTEKGTFDDDSLDIKKQKQPHYHYNSLSFEHPLTPLCRIHRGKCAATTIPIPFSPVFSSTHCESSYFPTMPSSPALPTKSTASISSAVTVASSPKKKVKRWIVAALMIVVGLLIALTFILIGLGKAFSQPHHTTRPLSSVSQSILPSSKPIYTTKTTTATATVTNILVSSIHISTRP